MPTEIIFAACFLGAAIALNVWVFNKIKHTEKEPETKEETPVIEDEFSYGWHKDTWGH